jgi:RNA polymerase sigma-70 factor (ECF subfamily)
VLAADDASPQAPARRAGSGTSAIDEAMQQVASGDRAAFARLYDLVAPLVYGIALRVVRDPAIAEEVTQEAFVTVWRQAARFDSGRGTAKSWICAIAHRRAVDSVRHEQALRDREARAQAAPETVTETPEVVAEAAAERDRVRAALARLSDVQRDALHLAYFEGRTYREVAELLGAPLGTVKTRMRDGLASLSRLLGGRGG